MSDRKAKILVTGDYVQDVFIYTGCKPTPSSSAGPGTRHFSPHGGVFLIQDILESSKKNKKWKKDNNQAKFHYQVQLGLKRRFSTNKLPDHLRSYAIWSPHPKDAKDQTKQVWRCENTPPGYGMDPVEEKNAKSDYEKCGKGEKCESKCLFALDEPIQEPADIVVLDDAGLMIQHESCSALWPPFLKDKNIAPPQYIVLKMSHPLAQGALWEKLKDYRKNLVVIISINDIRRMEAGVGRRVSWERSVLELLCELKNHPQLKPLLECGHLIINFRSEGALWVERQNDNSSRYFLLFDPLNMEGENAKNLIGRVFGYQSCLTAGVVHWLANKGFPEEPDDCRQEDRPIAMGIRGGLRAMRILQEKGHGPVRNPDDSSDGVFPVPVFPAEKIAEDLIKEEGGFAFVEIPPELLKEDEKAREKRDRWSILAHQYLTEEARPLYGLGMLTARYGIQAVMNNAPIGQFGNMVTVDRTEIESLRNIARLIEDYEAIKVQETPLSIAVFGAPGSGKSFGVKEIAKSFMGKEVPILTFNLSQFRNANELVGAFHQVRDKVLEGKTPLVFWDEFDSRGYYWLQYLLAPMQDGSFQDEQITHPIGKCVFVFAGGTSYTLENFGPMNPEDPNYEKPESEEVKQEDVKAHRDFQLKKGPDFISRLHGFINILGPNPKQVFDPKERKWIEEKENGNYSDLVFPIRRALMLRGQLRLGKEGELHIDHGLLSALLRIEVYRHGARSLGKVVQSLKQGKDGQLSQADLPAPQLLDREFDEEAFHNLIQRRNPFKLHPKIEELAAGLHENYRNQCNANGEAIDPKVDVEYASLSANYKEANRQAAIRIPEILELIDLYVVDEKSIPAEGQALSKDELEKLLKEPLTLEMLSQAEHLLWCIERRSKGWKYAPERKNEKKEHPALVNWFVLSPGNKKKDRDQIRAYPKAFEIAHCVAVQSKPEGEV